jgi:hypothetical protein
MTRLISIAAAAVALLGAVPAVAQGGAYYVAKPAAELKKASIITRNTVWKCRDGVCLAPKSADRPAIMCELVAREAGKLELFTVAGAQMDAAALDKCNARAK